MLRFVKTLIKKLLNQIRDATHILLIRVMRLFEPQAKGLILVWHSSGMYILSELHAAIAFSLSLRGIRPHFVLCDSSCRGACIIPTDPPCCNAPVDEWQIWCSECVDSHVRLMKRYGFDYSFVSEYMDEKDFSEVEKFTTMVKNYVENGMISKVIGANFKCTNVGRDVVDTLIRHYKDTNYKNFRLDHAEIYTHMGCVSTVAMQKSIRKYSPSHFFVPHAQYVPAGPAAKVLLCEGKSFFSYASHHFGGFVNSNNFNAFVYKTITPYDNCMSLFALSDTAWDTISNGSMSPKVENTIQQFFEERYILKTHTDMAKDLRFNVGSDRAKFYQKYCLTKDKPIFSVFTHITWDNAFGNGDPPFENFDEWLDFTISTIWNCKDVQWLIKIHPSEMLSARGNTGTGALAYITKKFPKLPTHIQIIPSNEQISPFDFMRLIDGVISCCGTSGLEASTLGKCVINACFGYYACRGFTYDANTKEDYAQLLRDAHKLPPITPRQIELAKKFHYTYFVRRNIGIDLYGRDLKPKSLRALWQHKPKHNSNLDLICEGLMNKTDILLPD